MRLACWASLDVCSELLGLAASSVSLLTGSGSFDSLALSFDITVKTRNKYSTVIKPVVMILGKNVLPEVDDYKTCLLFNVPLA